MTELELRFPKNDVAPSRRMLFHPKYLKDTVMRGDNYGLLKGALNEYLNAPPPAKRQKCNEQQAETQPEVLEPDVLPQGAASLRRTMASRKSLQRLVSAFEPKSTPAKDKTECTPLVNHHQ